MIKRIKLQNFKSHKNTDLALSKVNIIIGPNSSGKSNVFQSLLFLKRLLLANYNITLDAALNFTGLGYINLGTFEDIKHLKCNVPVGISVIVGNNEYGIRIPDNSSIDVRLSIDNGNIELNAERRLNIPYTNPSQVTCSLGIDKERFSVRWDGLFNFAFQTPQPPINVVNEFNEIKSKIYDSLYDIYLVPWFKLGFITPDIPLATVDIRNQLIIPETYVANKVYQSSDIHDYIEESTGELFNRRVRYHPQQNKLELYVSLRRGRTIKLVNEGGGLNRFMFCRTKPT